MHWSCPPAALPGSLTWSTAIPPLEAARSQPRLPATPLSTSRQATSLIFQSASLSWDEPLANQLSSSSPTPSSKAQRFVARPSTCPLRQTLDLSRKGRSEEHTSELQS